MLSTAINIAVKAHEGQRDKAHAPYILHPLHVMNSVERLDLKIIAVLHDVLEDSDFTSEDLAFEGISEGIIYVVKILSHRKGEDYKDYILRVGRDKNATIVKIADLEHNMDIKRLGDISMEDIRRLKKYQSAYTVLKSTRWF